MPASPAQVFASLRPAEAGPRRDLTQRLGIADIQALDKMGLEQGLHDGLGAAFVAGEADQSMCAQRVWRPPDPLEGEFDALGAPRVSDRGIEPLGLSGAVKFDGR